MLDERRACSEAATPDRRSSPRAPTISVMTRFRHRPFRLSRLSDQGARLYSATGHSMKEPATLGAHCTAVSNADWYQGSEMAQYDRLVELFVRGHLPSPRKDPSQFVT